MEQISLKFAAGAAAMLLLVPTTTGIGIPKAADAAAGFMIPLFTYPGGGE